MVKKDYDKLLERCIVEMFKRVGVRVKNLSAVHEWITKQVNPCQWYMAKSWTTEQESNFKEWMRRELDKHTTFSPRHREYEIGSFLLMWGWTTLEDNTDEPKEDKASL